MPRSRDTLSRAEARRLCLAAQSFADPRPEAPGARHLARVTGRLHLLQIDSVNVLARAHTVPLFSRLGPYDTSLLDEAAYRVPADRSALAQSDRLVACVANLPTGIPADGVRKVIDAVRAVASH